MPQDKAALRARQTDDARLAETPEAKAAIHAMLVRHYRAWVDMKIPALGGRTPREAVRDVDGR